MNGKTTFVLFTHFKGAMSDFETIYILQPTKITSNLKETIKKKQLVKIEKHQENG